MFAAYLRQKLELNMFYPQIWAQPPGGPRALNFRPAATILSIAAVALAISVAFAPIPIAVTLSVAWVTEWYRLQSDLYILNILSEVK